MLTPPAGGVEDEQEEVQRSSRLDLRLQSRDHLALQECRGRGITQLLHSHKHSLLQSFQLVFQHVLEAIQTTWEPSQTIRSTLGGVKAALDVHQAGLNQRLHMDTLRLLHLLLTIHVLPVALLLHLPNLPVTVVLQTSQTTFKAIQDFSAHVRQSGVNNLIDMSSGAGARDWPASGSFQQPLELAIMTQHHSLGTHTVGPEGDMEPKQL
ncbi:hypothetical protein INR49_009088 [Caranx melampygus]|nr:hypothetical protein INR49_009088 [Caranx melampygus]